jgi:predicted MFS family arabinose efflux permease
VRAFKNPWWVVFGSTLGLIVGNGPITLFTFGVFLKPIVAEFGWHRATVAAAITISQLVGAICTPFVGRMVDRWGVRRVTLPFILMFAVATAAIALTPASPTVFILLYGLAGLAGAGQSPLNYAKAISAWFENRRGLALGIAMSGVGIGVALMPQLARVLISSFGWRGGYVGLGIATLVLGFPAVALFIREPGDYRREVKDVVKQALAPLEGMTAGEAARGTFQFWFVLVATSLVALSVNGTITHIVPILTDRGISVRLATSLLSVSGIALIGGRVVSGYFLDRFFAPYVAAGFFLLPVAGIALLSTGGGTIAPLVATICLGIGIGSEIDMIAFLAGRYFGVRNFGEIYGYIMAVFLFSSGLGPAIMDLSFDWAHSYNFALLGFAVLLLGASLLISRLGPYKYPAKMPAVVSGAPSAGFETQVSSVSRTRC